MTTNNAGPTPSELADPRVLQLRAKGNFGKGRTKAETDELLVLVMRHRGLL